MESISIGNHVRIDDFCILSGDIEIGNYVHISAQCALFGNMGIIINDFSGISPGCRIFSATDDFSGKYMAGPLLPNKLRDVTGGKVIIEKYVQIGSGCTILPNLKINEGVAVGAMSLVNKSLEPWCIYSGIPAKYLKDRSRHILELVKQIKS
jgi:galactoside O-acetyltransferase